jgi:hypothetical protein
MISRPVVFRIMTTEAIASGAIASGAIASEAVSFEAMESKAILLSYCSICIYYYIS